MKWTRLLRIPDAGVRSQKVKKALQAVNDKITELAAKRAAVDKLAADIQAVDVTSVDPAAGPDLRSKIVACLQTEIGIRRDIAATWPAVHDEIRKAAERLREDHAAAVEDVTAKLVGIGYHTQQHDPIGYIQPGWLQAHPTVQRLRVEADAMFSRSNDTAAMNENAQLLAATIDRLQQAQRQAASV